MISQLKQLMMSHLCMWLHIWNTSSDIRHSSFRITTWVAESEDNQCGPKMLQVKFPETEGLADVGCSDTLTYYGEPKAANPGGLEGTKGRGDRSEAVTPCGTRARGRH